jgi:long-chain acyl-CoA synthetase
VGELISGQRRWPPRCRTVPRGRPQGLASLGIGKGDLIALYLRNDFPFVEASTRRACWASMRRR